MVSDIELDSLISNDGSVECFNRFNALLEYKNNFKLVINSLSGQFGQETTHPNSKIRNDDGDASDHADHLLNNPNLKNVLLSSLSVAQTGKSLSNSVMKYMIYDEMNDLQIIMRGWGMPRRPDKLTFLFKSSFAILGSDSPRSPFT